MLGYGIKLQCVLARKQNHNCTKSRYVRLRQQITDSGCSQFLTNPESKLFFKGYIIFCASLNNIGIFKT